MKKGTPEKRRKPTPEELAELYEVKAVFATSDRIRELYQQDKWLRWSVDPERWNIKIWSSDEEEHPIVDSEAWMRGTYGNLKKSHGIYLDF